MSGRTGELLWTYLDDVADGQVDVMNLYTGQFVDDVDGDGVPDIVNVHGGDPFAQPGQLASPLYRYNVGFNPLWPLTPTPVLSVRVPRCQKLQITA